jgi:hypothetical protein
METAKAMKAYKAPVQPKQLGGVPKAPSVKAATAPKAKSWVEMNPAEVHHLVEKEVQQNTHAELEPLRQQRAGINSTEAGANARYASLGASTLQTLGNVQTGAENTAKTNDNATAEAALKAQEAVDSTGQTQANPTQNAQQAAERTNLASLGQAAQAGASTLGQNEVNFTTNLRAAAAQRIGEGQKGIATDYAKERNTNIAEEDKYLGKESGQISKLDESLLQRQFADRATQAKLESEGVKAKALAAADYAKASEAPAKNALNQAKATEPAAKNELNRAKTTEPAAKNELNRAKAQQEIPSKAAANYAKASEAPAKIKAYLAKAQKEGQGSLTQSEQNKITEELGKAYEVFTNLRAGAGQKEKAKKGSAPSNAQIRTALVRGGYLTQREGKTVKETWKAVTNQTLINTAQELYDFHKVSAATKMQLERIGFPTKGVDLWAIVGERPSASLPNARSR